MGCESVVFGYGYIPSKDSMPSILEQYRISDFLEWQTEKRLELNPDFQRGSVLESSRQDIPYRHHPATTPNTKGLFEDEG